MSLYMSGDNQKSRLSKGKIIAIIIGSTVFAMCVLLGLAILLWKKKVKKDGEYMIFNL